MRCFRYPMAVDTKLSLNTLHIPNTPFLHLISSENLIPSARCPVEHRPFTPGPGALSARPENSVCLHRHSLQHPSTSSRKPPARAHSPPFSPFPQLTLKNYTTYQPNVPSRFSSQSNRLARAAKRTRRQLKNWQKGR